MRGSGVGARALRVLGLLGVVAVSVAASTDVVAGAVERPPVVRPDSLRPVPPAASLALPAPLRVDDDSSRFTLGSLLPDGWTVDSLYGRSGKLRARLVSEARRALTLPILSRFFGDSAISRPGVYTVRATDLTRPLAFITLHPFAEKESGRIGNYRVGFWPAERGRLSSEAYENPEGFIEVTRENQDTYVSEHFRLRDFLTKDQRDVWPKYLVLDMRLVDKLELVISDLKAHGVPVRRMVVMSGFRTPQYNQLGVGRGGRARDSRHQFGDAADVFVDNNGDGRLDDLNRDGRVNTRDVQVILRAVDRVEKRHPELVGGLGGYRATRAHGPFAHIDVRGRRARWGRV